MKKLYVTDEGDISYQGDEKLLSELGLLPKGIEKSGISKNGESPRESICEEATRIQGGDRPPSRRMNIWARIFRTLRKRE